MYQNAEPVHKDTQSTDLPVKSLFKDNRDSSALLHFKTAPHPVRASASEDSGVVQGAFTTDSVTRALLGAKGPANDMGGTTGGAYKIVTGDGDKDVSVLVVKVAGSDSAVLASQIFDEIGVPAPKSVMIPATADLLEAIGKVSSTLKSKLEGRLSIEVQQHTSVASVPNAMADTSGDQKKAAILAGDTLMGNHDRIHSPNKENIAGNFAIDNSLLGDRDSFSSEAMMKAMAEIVADAGKIHPQINKIAQMNWSSYGGNIMNALDGLKTQRTFILSLKNIAAKADSIFMLIEETNAVQELKAKAHLEELIRLRSLDEADMSNPFERVIASRVKELHTTREKILDSNIEMGKKDIDQDRYVKLKERLAVICKMDKGELDQAIKEVSAAILEVEKQIKEEDSDRHDKWEEKKKQAKVNATAQWEKKTFKFFSNKETYIQDLMDLWGKSNPEPRARI